MSYHVGLLLFYASWLLDGNNGRMSQQSYWADAPARSQTSPQNVVVWLAVKSQHALAVIGLTRQERR